MKTYNDWKGNEIKPGQTVYLMRVYEITWSRFIPDLPMPNLNKPAWERIATFNIIEPREGVEKLIRYLRNGYDKDKIYDCESNANDLSHAVTPLYAYCIKGISDSELEYTLAKQNITTANPEAQNEGDL